MTIEARPSVAIALLLSVLAGCKPATDETKAPRAAKANVEAAANRAPAAASNTLLALMRERLLLMHNVARWKWKVKQPIADPEREKMLLAELQRRGADYGLAPDEVRSFMRAQIEAGKLVQQADWRQWEAEGLMAFADAPDLQTELRPKIDRLSQQLLAAYAEFLPQLAEPGARERFERQAELNLVGEGIDEKVRTRALADWGAASAEPAAR